MTIIDTRDVTAYSPLIPAIKAICTTPRGQKLEIVLRPGDAFQDLKEYLSEQGIGFREIYDGDVVRLQFTVI